MSLAASGLASWSPEMARRLRKDSSLGCRVPSRSRSTGVTLGQPPRARMPSYWPIACAVVSAVEADKVGSEAFGMWMVREALSKPSPSSWPCVWSISAWRSVSAPAACAGRARNGAASAPAPMSERKARRAWPLAARLVVSDIAVLGRSAYGDRPGARLSGNRAVRLPGSAGEFVAGAHERVIRGKRQGPGRGGAAGASLPPGTSKRAWSAVLEAIQDLVGPEPLETMQRLVERRAGRR